MPLRIGETFAEYRVLRLLGSGGMGEVYVVQHPRLPRQEALKVLRPDISKDPSFRERFIREADLAAGLRHPHIVGIHDRGDHDGQLWIAMDYIDGTDAAHLLDQKYPAGMPVDLVLPIITAVASALDYAHKKGLLHRDIKPANIIVADLDSDDPGVFLADFGIARPLDDVSGITTTNMTVGTVAYAAPEQLMGEEIDGRADQYALAATAYHLLTGAQLFPHSNPAVVISRHLSTIPPRLGDRRTDCAGLDEVLQIALSKRASDRFPSCSAFAQALADESSGMGASANASTQAARQPRRSVSTSAAGSPVQPAASASPRIRLALASIVVIVLLVGLIAMVWRPWDERRSSGSTMPTRNATLTDRPSPLLPAPSSASPPPPAPSPSSTPLPAPEAPEAGRAREQSFLAALDGTPISGPNHVSYSMIPGSHGAYMGDPSAWTVGGPVVKYGYEACAVLKKYPSDREQATATFYEEHGYDTKSASASTKQEMATYMEIAATYLCG